MSAKTRGRFLLTEVDLTPTLQELCIMYDIKHCPYVMLGPSMTSEKLSQLDEEILYKCCTNSELIKLLNWINTNIVEYYIANGESALKTVNVRIRIATGMLNNLFINETIGEWLARIIHENFTENLQQLQADIRSDGLPF